MIGHRTRRSVVKTKKRKEVRLQVFERSGGRCELNIRKDCMGIVPFAGKTPYDHGHLVHLKSEGSGGKTDTKNCRWGCWPCHLLALHRGEVSATNKPCPPKIKPIVTDTVDWTLNYYGN